MAMARRQYRDAPVDVKVRLCAYWVAMLFAFVYVDVFGFFRADVLNAALAGKVVTTAFTVNQMFLTTTLLYILFPTLMVVLSLLLKPPVNRVVNIVVSLFYIATIIASCIGETWFYYLLGSAIEVVLLAAIIQSAWTWPAAQAAIRGNAP